MSLEKSDAMPNAVSRTAFVSSCTTVTTTISLLPGGTGPRDSVLGGVARRMTGMSSRARQRRCRIVMCTSPAAENETPTDSARRSTSDSGSDSSRSSPASEPTPALSSSSSISASSKVKPRAAASKGSNDNNDDESSSGTSGFQRRRMFLGGLFVAFVVYATTFAPESDWTSPQLSSILARDLSSVNTIFFAIFNLLSCIGVNYAIALNPGASQQPKWLPTRLLTLGGIVFGWGAVGPYVALRTPAPRVSAGEVRDAGVISRILESKWLSISNLVFCLLAYAYGFGLFSAGSETLHDLMFFSSLIDLSRLAVTDRFVNVSCVDFVFLSLLFWGPLTEDMRRRGWFTKGRGVESALSAALILSTPALGAALYFALRPPLPEELSESKNKNN